MTDLRRALAALAALGALAACSAPAQVTITASPDNTLAISPSETALNAGDDYAEGVVFPEGAVVPADAARLGSVEPCRLPNTSPNTDVSLGWPRNPDRLTSTGDVRVAVIFVDFPDAPAAESTADALARISAAPEYYDAVSYGRMHLTLDADTAWHRMSLPSTAYSFDTFDSHLAYVAEAVALADPTFDFSGDEDVVVMIPEATPGLPYGPTLTAGYGWGFSADGRDFANAITVGGDLSNWGYFWLNHEMGHSMGLDDLYGYEGDDIHRYVGDFSMMGYIGGTAPEYFAWERWLLGWIDDDQIACQPDGFDPWTLTALEAPGGLKALVIPTGNTTAIVVESRRALGYDAGIVKEGVLAYSVDTSVASGYGPVVVFPNDGGDRRGAPLQPGESLELDGVVITVVSADATTDVVQVDYLGD